MPRTIAWRIGIYDRRLGRGHDARRPRTWRVEEPIPPPAPRAGVTPRGAQRRWKCRRRRRPRSRPRRWRRARARRIRRRRPGPTRPRTRRRGRCSACSDVFALSVSITSRPPSRARPIERVLLHAVPQLVEGVRHVDEAALTADRRDGLVRFEPERHTLGEEQADQLARGRLDFLTDDHRDPEPRRRDAARRRWCCDR